MNNISSPKLIDIMNSSAVEHLNLATFYPTFKVNIFFGAIRNTGREERYVLSALVHYTLLRERMSNLTNHKYGSDSMFISSQSLIIRNFPLSS